MIDISFGVFQRVIYEGLCTRRVVVLNLEIVPAPLTGYVIRVHAQLVSLDCSSEDSRLNSEHLFANSGLDLQFPETYLFTGTEPGVETFESGLVLYLGGNVVGKQEVVLPH